MASFRTGFKIFGELSIKQGLGRIRSFSEDRKPGRWLPEDQWAVRQPGQSTCPEPCDQPKKPPKPSKSWLSVCKDPETPIPCDVRHSNCPPPPVKPDGPWYSLDNLIPKKKHEKPPPLRNCREELKRLEMQGEEEEVCEKLRNKNFPLYLEPDPIECCTKPEPCPAPVVTLSCPLPKELDIMLWCGRPSTDSARIAAKCQSDKLPYQEFRPQRCWKPVPFSLPKADHQLQTPCCNTGPIAYAEFKHVEVPKPLYTRYKSVELTDCNFMLCMIDAKCPDNDHCTTRSAVASLPNPKRIPPSTDCCKSECKKCEPSNEKPFIEAGSCRPTRLKCAPKYTFRPKPTKLIEKRISKNPCAQCKSCDLQSRNTEEEEEGKSECKKRASSCEPPKVLTGTLTKEPQCYERNFPMNHNPPMWMSLLCKPGAKSTPLVPKCDEPPPEPDCCAETDGLKFYDDDNTGIKPKPPPDPCKAAEKAEQKKKKVCKSPPKPKCVEPPKPANRFVLMPESFNIKQMRFDDPASKDKESSTFEEFIEAKTASTKTCSKSYPPMKENILYDLQRMCPNVPFDPSKLNAPCRKPPKQDCACPPSFYRSFSTLTPAALRTLRAVELCNIQRRTECGDSSGKCKVRPIKRVRECPQKPKPVDCAEITLPCCPKARIPPNCSFRKPMPPCKKKLPPKPSFSECSRDPPPCPKMTECNCWEKKPPKK